MKHTWIEFIIDSMIIMSGLVLLTLGVGFQMQFLQSGYSVQEPNPFIFWFEVSLYCFMVLVGTLALIKDRYSGSFREILGDVIVLSTGLLLLGIFVVILFHGKFYLYQVEPAIIIVRLILAIFIIVLGLDRLIDDARR